jgi:two-component system OmpR family sensor kinase
MAAVVVMLALVGVVVTRTTEDRLVRQVDEQLIRADDNGPPRNNGTFSGQFPPAQTNQGPFGNDAPANMYVGWLDADGDLVDVRLPNTRATATAPDLSAATIRAASGGAPFTARATGSDLRYRVVVSTFRIRPTDTTGTSGTSRVTVYRVYAVPLEDVDDAVDQLIVVEILASLAIVAVLGMVTFWVLRLGVRPLKAMTETATAIGEGDLSRRIPPTAPGTEAGDLGIALNKMLGRIEESFDQRARSETRLRRFVADASHELRTPLTTIRGYAELYRRGGLPPGEPVDEAMRRTEAEAIRMGSLVEDLLHLARLDERRPLQLGPVDLAAVVTDGAADAQAVEPDRPISLGPVEAVTVIGDEPKLRQVVANLLNNVRVHTPPTAAVEVRLRHVGDFARIEIVDHGPGMSADHAERAFERFYRADAARSRHTGGSGLGLSIVESVLEAHDGTAEIETVEGVGTTVRLLLPLGGPAVAATAEAGIAQDVPSPPPAEEHPT